MTNLTIVIPTYNEAANLPRLIERLRSVTGDIAAVRCRVMVVDDDSPDGTGKVAEELAKRHSGPDFRVQVLHRTVKEGLGRAYAHAFNLILEEGGTDYVMQMDADFSHDPSYIPAFLAASAEADFVVGSRYVPGGGTPDWAWDRRLLSRGGNLYARLFLGSRVTDYTGGFNLIHVDLLRRCDIGSLRAGGYDFAVEFKFRALQRSRAVRQVPIVFRDRRVGESKLPRSTLLRNLIVIPSMRWADFRGRSPR